MAKVNNFPKAITLFHIRDGFDITYDKLLTFLESRRFKGIAKEACSYRAFVPVMAGEQAPLAHAVGGFDMNPDRGGFVLKMGVEEKSIPAATVTRLVGQAVKKIEDTELRFVRGKERTELTYKIREDMALTAPVTFRSVSTLVLPSAGIAAVFATAGGDIDDINALVRSALGSYPIMPYTINDFIGLTGLVGGYGAFAEVYEERLRMSQMAIAERLGENINYGLISLKDDVVVECPDDSTHVRFAGRGADCDGVKREIEDGMKVRSIQLSFGDAFKEFNLSKEFKLTNVKWALKSSDDDGELIKHDGDEELDASEYANLVLAGDLELVRGVVTDLHHLFFPIFGNVAHFEAQAS